MDGDGVRIGLRGSSLGRVDASGVVQLDGRRTPIGWWVAADDRWHDPCQSPTVRQRRLSGTPVVETKLAVPGGDVVQTLFVVADQGGCLVAHYENRSPAAVVVAVPAHGAGSTAATSGTMPQGINLPDGVRAFPLAHGGGVTFAWSVGRRRWRQRTTIDATTLASAEHVVRGWVNASERASRIPSEAQRLTTMRCDLLLAEPDELDALLQREPSLGVIAVAERVRMGDPAEPWVEQCADAVRRIAKRPANTAWSSRAFSLAAYVLMQSNEHRAAADVIEVWRRTTRGGSPKFASGGSSNSTLADSAVGLARVEDGLVRAVDPDHVHLLPDGATPWLGANFEAHGVHAGPLHRLSFAVRWHGENAALLWELDGPAGLRLLAPKMDPAFATSEARGEALLKVKT